MDGGPVKPRAKSGDVRLLFATDLHGSDATFRKFVNAAKQLSVDVMLLGGDLAGKAVVPVIGENGHYTARVFGREQTVESGSALDDLNRAIRATGQYVYVCDRERFEDLRTSPAEIESVFADAMSTALVEWLDLAHERLAGTGIRLVAVAGNDDPFPLDAVIDEHPFAELCDERIVELEGGLEIVGFSGSNRTPWDSPREYDEDEIERRLTAVMDTVADPARAILNVHPPPAQTGLDSAAQLDADFNVVFESGAVKMIPVGSTAVREAIERYQPLLGAHGHVHESRGMAHLGSSLVLNPGSEYGEGLLAAALVRITRKGVKGQFLSG
jgi:uncharacterized protein